MQTAANAPVRKSRAEVNTGEMEMQSRPKIVMPDSGLPTREDIVPAVDGIKVLQKKYLQDLAFNEEPVMIRIASSNHGEKNPPKVVDCWCNGVKAEQFIDGKWVQCGWLPIDKPVITKRKYVEILLRSKRDQIETKHQGTDHENPENALVFNTHAVSLISIMQDKNPAGIDWLTQIMYER